MLQCGSGRSLTVTELLDGTHAVHVVDSSSGGQPSEMLRLATATVALLTAHKRLSKGLNKDEVALCVLHSEYMTQ